MGQITSLCLLMGRIDLYRVGVLGLDLGYIILLLEGMIITLSELRRGSHRLYIHFCLILSSYE